MKHKLSKLTSLFLAVAMALAMVFTAVPAKAANTSSLKVTNNGKTAHTFEIYQIFTGKATDATDAGTGKLSDVQWGNGITDAGKTALYEKYKLTGDNQTAAKVAEALAKANDADAFAAAIGTANLQNGTESKSVAAGGDDTFSNLASGYYLVIDKAQSQDNVENGAYTRYIVAVAGAAEMNTKLDVPSSEKKVNENVKDVTGTSDSNITSFTYNAETDTIKKYNDVADYSIGDEIPYMLVGTLPTNYDKYETYKYKFVDTMDPGLSLINKADGNPDVTVQVQNGAIKTDITSNFTITASTDTEDTKKTTLSVGCDNLKNIKGTDGNALITKDSKIIVTYKAKLNSDAVIGGNGNVNEMHLEFSNNPNATGEGETGKTPEDKNIVFTYELDTTKVDAKDTTKTLANAKFKLLNSDKTKAAKLTAVTGQENTFKFDSWVDKDSADATEITTTENGLFKIQGLDDGTYYLKETEAPAGYNLLKDPVKVEIKATTANNQTWNGTATSALTALKIDVTQDGKTTEGTGNTTNGTVEATVANNQGSTLPSTGGIGTTIFYVVGGILVAGAAILLITRRRTER